MQSENFVFLTLFLSLLLALWGNTSSTRKNVVQLVPNNSPQVASEGAQTFVPLPVINQTVFNNSYFQANFSFFSSALLVFIANSVLSIFLLRRWIDSGYPPFSNLYESLLFLTWSLLFLYFPAIDFTKDIKILFNQTSRKNNSGEDLRSPPDLWSREEQSSGVSPQDLRSGASRQGTNSATETISNFEGSVLNPILLNNTDAGEKSPFSKKLSSLIGMLLVSSALFIYTFATWVLPSSMQEIKPLIPALKSNWLLMHVSIMLLSYSALLAGSLFSILYLVIFYLKGPQAQSFGLGKKEKMTNLTKETSFTEVGTLGVLENLDLLSYRSLGFAFPLLTLGIISGAVWANEAWGSYWSWDPKETWALITWFIYSIYLHLRIQKAWAGEKSALVGALGFFVVWICYLGVNLLGKGLHSYGFWD